MIKQDKETLTISGNGFEIVWNFMNLINNCLETEKLNNFAKGAVCAVAVANPKDFEKLKEFFVNFNEDDLENGQATLDAIKFMQMMEDILDE